MATIVVVGQLAEAASLGRGGHTMWVLQILHGLARLGHQVVFVEFVQRDPGPARHAMIEYFERTVAECWRADAASLMLEPTMEALSGLDHRALARWAHRADALLTLAAHYRPGPYPLLERTRPRILFEQDPGYTQLWAAAAPSAADIYGEHDLYFTVGAHVGTERCALPTLGLPWQPLWNPVVLSWWAPAAPVARDGFSTACDWRSQGYDYLEFEGRMLGPKAEEFRRFLTLPALTGEAFEMVITIDPADPDVELLRAHGWRLLPPSTVWSAGLYHRFVQGAAAEFSCAKGGYVGTHSGWFSDRSACYLAAGRPVVLQATGFEDLLPTGRGLFAVRDAAEAAEAIRMVRRDYRAHATAARALAVEHFDSDRLLGRMLDAAGLTRSPAFAGRRRRVKESTPWR